MASETRFTLTLATGDVRHLDRLAKADGRSRTGLLRLIVARFIAERKAQK